MKKNGFMLVETLVASTFILGALIFLYVQFSAIKRNYERSFKYDTIVGLYNAKTFATFLESDGYVLYDYELRSNDEKGYIRINDCHSVQSSLCSKIVKNINAKHILFVGDNISTLQSNLSISNYDQNIFFEGLRQYILSLNSVDLEGRSRLIIEYNDNTFASVAIGVSNADQKRVDYTVNHHLKNIDGTYTLKESEVISWIEGYETQPDVKTYTGFTSPDVQTITIAKNSVVNYYYDRNKYTLTINKGAHVLSTTGSGTYYYGEVVEVSATAEDGYEISGYSDYVTDNKLTMPAKNITITALAK